LTIDLIFAFNVWCFLQANHKWYLVVQVEIKNGRKTVTIRSPLQVGYQPYISCLLVMSYVK